LVHHGLMPLFSFEGVATYRALARRHADGVRPVL